MFGVYELMPEVYGVSDLILLFRRGQELLGNLGHLRMICE